MTQVQKSWNLSQWSLLMKLWNSFIIFVSLSFSSFHLGKLAFIKHGNYKYYFIFLLSWFAPFLLLFLFLFMLFLMRLPLMLLTWRSWPLVLLPFFQSLAPTPAMRLFLVTFFLLFLLFFQAMTLFCLVRGVPVMLEKVGGEISVRIWSPVA